MRVVGTSSTILKFAVYTGVLDYFGAKGHAANVVLHLMETKLNVRHSLFMDNYYNSYDLARLLLDRGAYCTGTLRIDRKKTPEEVKRQNLKKGATIARFADGVMIAKWHEKRDVSYISTEFGNQMVVVQNKRQQEVEKPQAIVIYNKSMGGVDQQDQMMAYYSCPEKLFGGTKSWGHIFYTCCLSTPTFCLKNMETTPVCHYMSTD
jgi:predicted fused transcriptional regulator/phosphomethylpyrimidine kinase